MPSPLPFLIILLIPFIIFVELLWYLLQRFWHCIKYLVVRTSFHKWRITRWCAKGLLYILVICLVIEIFDSKPVDTFNFIGMKVRKVGVPVGEVSLEDIPLGAKRDDYSRVGLGITIDLDYVTSGRPMRSSYEAKMPGVNGLYHPSDNRRLYVEMEGHELIDLGDYLISDKLTKSRSQMNGSYRILRQKVSFNDFKESIAYGDFYARAIVVDGNEFVFWIENESIISQFLASDIVVHVPECIEGK
ncbi:hypothetical protein OAT16_01810 [Prolixibacteraceae bacterium]|nr:hypothetical protein [Prolixibacteraceae bacterium]